MSLKRKEPDYELNTTDRDSSTSGDEQMTHKSKKSFLQKDTDFLVDSDYCSKSSVGSVRLKHDDVRKKLMETLSEEDFTEENSEESNFELVSTDEELPSNRSDSGSNESWTEKKMPDLKTSFKSKKKPTKKSAKKTNSVTRKTKVEESDDEFKNQSSDAANDSTASISSCEFLSPKTKDSHETLTTEDDVVDFFNNATDSEFKGVLNLTSNKYKAINSLRPFADYEDLCAKMKTSKSNKNVSQVFINSAIVSLNARKAVNQLLERCKEISKEVKKKVNCIMQKNQESNDSARSKFYPEYKLKPQPSVLNKNYKLKSYQIIGMNWLILMHEHKLNSILADEMGLGKTCQAIAFLAYLYEQNNKLVHLIVVPASTLDNWAREISEWFPDNRVQIYKGSLQERATLRTLIQKKIARRKLNTILTTYNYVYSQDADKAFFRKLNLEYCVYDEAHMLKSMKSLKYTNLMQIKSKRRLLLTGTPLQNNLTELMSLLNFVTPNIFKNKTSLVNKMFLPKAQTDEVNYDAYYKEKIDQARGIMNPFILRRLKANVLKELPSKSETVIHCHMTPRQKSEYEKIQMFYRNQRATDLEANSQKESKKPKKTEEYLIDLKNIVSDKRKRVKNESRKDLWSEEDSDLDTGDVRKDQTVIINDDYKLDCDSEDSINSKSRDNITVDSGDEETKMVELFDQVNLAKEDHKKKPKKLGILAAIGDLRMVANHALLRRSIYDDEKIKEMAGHIMKQSSADTVLEYVIEDMAVMNDFELHNLCSFYTGLDDYKLPDSEILESGKFRQLDKLLDEFKETGDRVLIFSQFKIMLDIIQEYLNLRKRQFVRLDGSTNVADRQALIDRYNKDKDIFIFLLTTKAGGVGINLTSANKVIIHDLDFNPQNDKQAEDRCHRVGQTKQVDVYKLISEDTIDQTLLKHQIVKIQLESDLSEGTRTKQFDFKDDMFKHILD